MDNKSTRPAILVDYDAFRDSDGLRRFVKDREGKALLVALVDLPEINAPEDHLDDDPDWDVVITNSKGLTYQAFVHNSLDALEHYSNIVPVMAVTTSHGYDELYMRTSVLSVVVPADLRKT